MHTIAMGRASAMPRNRRKVNELNSFTINIITWFKGKSYARLP